MLFYLCGAITLAINLTAFLILSDVSQMFFSFPRSVFYVVINRRYVLMGISIIAFILGFIAGISDAVSPIGLIIYALLFGMTFFSGFWAAPLFIFPSQHRDAQYTSISEVERYLSDDTEVMVLVNNQDAVAYPTDWIVRPHIAGVTVGGEDVVMTYCGLSHLSIPYKNNDLDLVAMAQIECNLVLVDNNTNEPIEQIYGRMVNQDKTLDRLSSTFMAFKAFRQLYPDGRVFLNPPGNIIDKVIRKALNTLLYGTHYNTNSKAFAFPNVKYNDNRIPLKEQVYGVEINGEAVAYRLDYLQNAGQVVDNVGGETITVKYFPEYDYVDMFYGDKQEVTPHDNAQRVPHASRILWGIWSNFYRDTSVKT